MAYLGQDRGKGVGTGNPSRGWERTLRESTKERAELTSNVWVPTSRGVDLQHLWATAVEEKTEEKRLFRRGIRDSRKRKGSNGRPGGGNGT